MQDQIQNQTDQLLVWLKTIDHSLQILNYSVCTVGVFVVVLLLVIAFRRRQ
jgi:hypothetical protein